MLQLGEGRGPPARHIGLVPRVRPLEPDPLHSMKRLTIVTAVLLALLAVPAAEASTKQVTILQDDVHLRHDTAATLDEFAALGADVVKIGLSWEEVAPDGRRKPSGFDASNPAGYQWSNYGAVIDAISARGMRPYVSIVGLAPDWASKRGGRRGTNRPSSKEYGLFAEAVGQAVPERRPVVALERAEPVQLAEPAAQEGHADLALAATGTCTWRATPGSSARATTATRSCSAS